MSCYFHLCGMLCECLSYLLCIQTSINASDGTVAVTTNVLTSKEAITADVEQVMNYHNTTGKLARVSL